MIPVHLHCQLYSSSMLLQRMFFLVRIRKNSNANILPQLSPHPVHFILYVHTKKCLSHLNLVWWYPPSGLQNRLQYSDGTLFHIPKYYRFYSFSNPVRIPAVIASGSQIGFRFDIGGGCMNILIYVDRYLLPCKYNTYQIYKYLL